MTSLRKLKYNYSNTYYQIIYCFALLLSAYYPGTYRYSGQVGTCSDCHRDEYFRGKLQCRRDGPRPGMLPQNHAVRHSAHSISASSYNAVTIRT